MKYEKIKGWFDFDDVYNDAIKKFQEGIFVEVGCWLGKSTCCMAELIAKTDYDIKFYAVDTWRGSNEEAHIQFINSIGGPDELYNQFINNMKAANVLQYITPIRLTSTDASKMFDDKSIEFVFLDASHFYEDILNDIECWLPKIKPGGIIAGHDYTESDPHTHGVIKAVKETFETNYKIQKNSWIHQTEA
jgi:predicted O-methyltransferase YrrM